MNASLRLLKTRLCGWKTRPAASPMEREQVFTSIYAEHAWEGQSVSGQGSDGEQTAYLRQQLPVLFAQWNVRRVLDAPCGDFNWMQHVPLSLDEYIGADIVAELIADNQAKYGDTMRRFAKLDIARDDLPTVDLILCRDCLVHLCFRDIRAALNNFKRSGSTYLLTTTFPQQPKNWDIQTGEWRGLNLQAAPFRFPPPLHLLNEHCPESADKSLGLWKLADMPFEEKRRKEEGKKRRE